MSHLPHVQAFAEQFAEMFELKQLISPADSAVIYRAFDRLREIPVCLKFYDHYPGKSQRRDWRINATIKSDFLATNFVVLVFLFEKRPFAVACLEWIEGPTFEQFAASISRLSTEQIYCLLHKLLREVLTPLAKNLDSLHLGGIGHGDLHGGNIKVRVRGERTRRSFECVVFDFYCPPPNQEDRAEAQLVEADVTWLKKRMHDILLLSPQGQGLLRVLTHAQSAGAIAFALHMYCVVFFQSDGGIFRRSRPIWAQQLSACDQYREREPDMVHALVALMQEVAENAGELEVFRSAQECLADPAYSYRDDDAPQLPISNQSESLAAQARACQSEIDITEQLIRLLPDQ